MTMMLMLARRLGRQHKLRVAAALVLAVLLLELYLVFVLIPAYMTNKKPLPTGQLPPAVFNYMNRQEPSRYLFKRSVKQEIAAPPVEHNEAARPLQSPEKSKRKIAIKWHVVSRNVNNSDTKAVLPEKEVAQTTTVSSNLKSPTSAFNRQNQSSLSNKSVQEKPLEMEKVMEKVQMQDTGGGKRDNSAVKSLFSNWGLQKIGQRASAANTSHTTTNVSGIKHKSKDGIQTQGSRPANDSAKEDSPVKSIDKTSFVEPHEPFPKQVLPQKSNICETLHQGDTFQTEFFCLKDVVNLTQQLFTRTKYGWCHVRGAELIDKRRECYCVSGWYGQHCSKPQVVEHSNYPYEYGVAVTDTPKRVIYAFPFNFEFELLEARLQELGDLVDVYVILESNYTASGRKKPLYLLQNLQKGYLKKHQSKILHVTMDFFPMEAYKDGWVVDEMLRHYLGNQALARIHNLRPDDVFIIADADELSVWETVFFLKYHYGYPEPIGFNLRHNVFAFYWQGDDLTTHVFGACSVAMLQKVFGGNPYHLRKATRHMIDNPTLVGDYKYRHSGRLQEWSFGEKETPAAAAAGWHCSWCFEAQRIQHKLLSAHLSDVPRWGNDPEKTQIAYISNLIQKGLWFDDKTRLLPVTDNGDGSFAPKYFQALNKTGSYLLKPP